MSVRPLATSTSLPRLRNHITGAPSDLSLRVHCNKTAELGVLSLMDNTHTSTAQLLNDSVVGDGLTDECFGFRHSDVMLGARLETSQRRETSLAGLRLQPRGVVILSRWGPLLLPTIENSDLTL